ncbi:MAG: peptidase MA family metallohydrolase, partial [Thermomicrobiaceae bacterium]
TPISTRSSERTMTASPSRGSPIYFLAVALISVLFVGMAMLGLVTPVSAQENQLILHDQSVEVDFPQQITFNLEFEAPEPVERLELRYQSAYSEVSRAERPDFEPGTSISTSYDLDLRTQYLPPGIDIEYRWIITLEDGQQLETDQQEFFFNDNRYDWQEFTEGDVSIYHYAGGSQFGELAMEVTNRTIENFGEDFDVQLDEPINIVIYGSVSDFSEALPYNSPEWIGGFADPGYNLIVAGISPSDGTASEMGRMMTHEVIHLLVDQATANPFNTAPRWLDEGLAINYQEVQEERFDDVLEQAVDEGRLIPLPALRSSFPSDPDLAIQSYAQSESVLAFMIEEYGHDAIASIMDAYQDGVSHQDAVDEAIGVTLEEIDEEWKQWLGYEGDATGGSASEPMTPGSMEQVEDALATLGIMPVLVIGGMVVVVLGVVRMVRAVNTNDLDEDVSPDVEYYGQDEIDDPDAEVPDIDDSDLPNAPRQP